MIGYAVFGPYQGTIGMIEPQIFESTAGQIAAELAERKIDPSVRVRVLVEPALTEEEKRAELKALLEERLAEAEEGRTIEANAFFQKVREAFKV